MRKVCNLALLTLLASTCTALAMDFVDETGEKSPCSQAVEELNKKMADGEWYDDTVAAGNSPESRERLKGLGAGDDAEALLESLTSSPVPSADKDPLKANVQIIGHVSGVLDVLAEEAAAAPKSRGSDGDSSYSASDEDEFYAAPRVYS